VTRGFPRVGRPGCTYSPRGLWWKSNARRYRLALRSHGSVKMASIGGLVPVMVLVDARGVKARRVVAMDFEALGGCSLEYAYVTDS
jgi:hypothetical protein